MEPKLKPMKEGAALEVSGRGPVRLRVTPINSASSMLEIGVDYSFAPVPDLRYDADYCDVAESRTGVVLSFGKLRARESQLRTKIEISFSTENFINAVWRNSRSLQEVVHKLSEGKTLAPIHEPLDSDRVQCFRATNVFMAVLSSEAVLDFYYISPGDVHLARTKKKTEVALEPVVRVIVSTPLLYEFLEKCKPLAEKLDPAIGEEEGLDQHNEMGRG
jgi:hypothetical protein